MQVGAWTVERRANAFLATRQSTHGTFGSGTAYVPCTVCPRTGRIQLGNWRGKTTQEVMQRVRGWVQRHNARCPAALPATKHVTDKRWLHVSIRRLKPGTVLRPGISEKYERMYAASGRGQYVWLTDTLKHACDWAACIYEDTGKFPKYVYEVRPHSAPEVYDEE